MNNWANQWLLYWLNDARIKKLESDLAAARETIAMLSGATNEAADIMGRGDEHIKQLSSNLAAARAQLRDADELHKWELETYKADTERQMETERRLAMAEIEKFRAAAQAWKRAAKFWLGWGGTAPAYRYYRALEKRYAELKTK